MLSNNKRTEMKQLQLDLNKRLLIVEIPEGKYSEEVLSEYKSVSGDEWDFLCKGSELTEEVAEDLVNIFDLSYYVDYKGHSPRCYVGTALESFISAIEALGHHWGENPVKFKENEMNWEKRHKNRIEWERAESRTFNPEKCIIFEIL